MTPNQEPKIVKITPIEDIFSITWNLHKRCNNDCMYCGEFLHDATSPVKSLEELQSQWLQIFNKTKHINKKYKISFTGGEAVINKNFMPFVSWLQENYAQYLHRTLLTSNGNASKDYYLKIFKDLSGLTLSTHTENFDIDRFMDIAINCDIFAKQHPGKFFMVNLMEEYWALDTIKQLIDRLSEHNIRFNLAKIEYNRKGSRDYPIFIVNKKPVPRPDLLKTEDAINQTHQALQEYTNIKKIPQDQFYNVEVEHDDQSTIKTYAARLNFLGLDHFTGWRCYAGLHRINITAHGEVFDGECYNESLGNLNDGSFQLRTEPGICRRATCTGNPDDVMVHKYISKI